ncbi:MAG: YihY/virulence factor BrkB family protein [Candidatus Bathyarchaeota archaeon]|nr:YihY/virulence factor BrkB family protein [Candidatus Bathyarchaeota archaeon]
MNKRQLYDIFRIALRDFLEDGAVLRAAALTFFIILPLPTLLLLAVGLFSIFLGSSEAVQILLQQITAVVGPAVAELFSQLITSTASPFTSIWTTIVVVGFSIGGAIGAFSVLRDTMDCIWEVTLPKGEPLWKRVRQKIVPFALVSALGLIVIAWTAIASTITRLIGVYSLNSTLAAVGAQIAEVLASFGVAMLLLAIIYKMIPQSKVHWQDVTLSAIVTAITFTITNYIFGAYISTFTPTTVAGAAGALLIILLWIFILNQIVLFGAEAAKVYATTVGTHAKQHLPKPIQKAVEPLMRAGEKIEEAAKETLAKISEPTVKPESTQTTSQHTLTASKMPSTQQTPTAQKDHRHTTIEINIKITPPTKKQNNHQKKA